MCQIPIKMLKQHTIPNSSLHNLKIYSSKGSRKTIQRWIICMMQLLNTHTAILNIRIFSRRYPITSDYGFLLRLVNTFTIDTDEYYLMCYKVNDTKTFKNLVGLTRNYFRLWLVLKVPTNQSHMYIADWLV